MSPARFSRVMPDVSLVVDSIRRGLAEDPLHFIVQSARRFGRVKGPDPSALSVRAAYRWFFVDRPDEARRVLGALKLRGRLRQRMARRLELQLGASRVDGQDGPVLKARSLYQLGRYSEAAAAAPDGSRLRERIQSELEIMQAAPSAQHSRVGRPDSVLFVLTNSLPYTQSGYSLRTQSLLRELQRIGVSVTAATRIGYPVTIGHVGKPIVAIVDGVAYRRLPASRLPLRLTDRLAHQVTSLERLMGEVKPGLLHCTTDFTNAIVTRELSRRTGLPWVYEMRGQLELSWVARLPAQLQHEGAASERVRLLRAKEVELANDANAVIVLSEVQASDLTARGVAREKITVIPNAIDAALLERNLQPADARHRVGLPTDGHWVGAVSSLVDYEGFDILLEAVAIARQRGSDIRVCLVGDGVSRPRLIARAVELGLGEAAVFPGKRPISDAPTWVQALDVVALPRRDTPVTRVVTPLKAVEAMSLRRPVIASDLPALAELVARPKSGILVRPDDPDELARALSRLAADQQLRDGLARNGRAFAAQRTWHKAAQTCREIYETVCDA